MVETAPARNGGIALCDALLFIVHANVKPACANSRRLRKVCVRHGEAASMKRSPLLVIALLLMPAAPARASCPSSMAGAYQIQCSTAARVHDDSAAIDACRSEADLVRACASDGQPIPGGVFLGADALNALANAYVNTNQRAKARAAYVESAVALETFARDHTASAAERRKAREAAAKARSAAAAL